jgi:hypothetical protein
LTKNYKTGKLKNNSNGKVTVASQFTTLVPEVYFYYFHCEGRRKNKPLVESGN